MDNKSGINSESNEDFELWVFPAISDKKNQDEEEVALQKAADEPIEVPKEDQELIQLKETLQEKITVLMGLHHNYLDAIQEIDAELVEKIVKLIKKTTYKIIRKELALDPQLLAEMVHSTLKQIEDYKECELHLSPEDYALWNDAELAELDIEVKEDIELKRGDYKLITPTHEIVAIIKERLNALFGK